MGYEIKMSEVIDMRKAVLAAYAAYETEIAAIDAARVNLMDPGVMEGKTADAISMYLNEVHGAIEYTLEQALTELKDRVVVYENGFANVDGSNEAHITQDSLENVQQRINGNMDEFVGYVTRLSGILESVSDIYPTYMPGTGEVSNKYDSSRAVAANLNENAGSYEAEHVGDCANINGILDSVLSIINAQNSDAIGIKGYTSGKIANLGAYQSLQQSYSASIEYYSEHMQDIVDAQNNIGEKIDAEAAAERAKKGFWDAVAAVGTMAIGAAAIICTGGAATPLVVAAGVSAMAYGASNLAEAGQEIYYGMNGDAKTRAFNPVRDTLFMGNQSAYDIWGSASTAMSLGFAFAGSGAQAAVAAGKANPLTLSSMAGSVKSGVTTFFKSGLTNMAKTGASFVAKSAAVGGTGVAVEKIVTPYTSEDFGRLMGLLTTTYVGSKVIGSKKTDSIEDFNIDDSTKPYSIEDFNSDMSSLPRPDIDDDTARMVLETEQGYRPDPSTYMDPKDIETHLSLFDSGVAKVSSESDVAYYRSEYGGTIGHPKTGTFVMPKDVALKAIDASDGNARVLEGLLGLDDGVLGESPVLINSTHPSNLRIPSGNEAGVNAQWIPGGFTSGNIPEAVIDQLKPDEYTVVRIFSK